MSHQRYPSHDAVKEPHSVSLKVLRLSRPSLVAQYPVQPPSTAATAQHNPPPIPASLAYYHDDNGAAANDEQAGRTTQTNPHPFILSPIVNLPPSFGSTYVGETFSCTLCANHDVAIPDLPAPLAVLGGADPDRPRTLSSTSSASSRTAAAAAAAAGPKNKKKTTIRDVRIEAEMKTPSSATVTKLELTPPPPVGSGSGRTDLHPNETLQKVVNFDLKEEGNHVLAVTVSYYEASDTSGRTRTFRKLYQFICKASLIVRTKPGLLPAFMGRRRWVLEAQLENCSEDTMQLERVVLDLEPGLDYSDCNWEASGSGGGSSSPTKPVLHPGEAEQVCFVVEEKGGGDGEERVKEEDGRVVFGVLGIGWRSEMGNRGFLSTGKLGTRHVKPRQRKA
ncbi:hypothetical protein B0H63DRAFT_144145 [Podospora didyma]|uniref:Trafficking protein particle complex subunit 13 n=1 Tax=Podospora didyma TaxID=330526 RepID=A0AAE0U1C0_9PEZI|nr:hypothetical protein B0H63DRAFT_144145 [Podospora didyma]